MHSFDRRPKGCTLSRCITICAILFVSSTTVGCVGLVANLMHVGLGNKVSAKYTGLDAQRVAVVCVSQSSLFGPTKAALEIADGVRDDLRKALLEIQLVGQQEIDAWTDEHDWNEVDFRELGEGVGAQKLVAIELKSFSLYEGKTLFKGRADVELTVYDLTQPGSEPAYHEVPAQIQYPITAGEYTADTSEEAFRRRFVEVVANRLARHFYDYDVATEFSQDRTALGF